MAYDVSNLNGVPGLLFPFVNNSTETGCMQDTKSAAGGFIVWGKEGEGDKCYGTKPAGDTSFFKGIAVVNQTKDEYKAGDLIRIMKKGRILVTVLGEVVSGGAAYIASNGLITGSSSNSTLIPGSTFKGNAADGGLVELEIA